MHYKILSSGCGIIFANNDTDIYKIAELGITERIKSYSIDSKKDLLVISYKTLNDHIVKIAYTLSLPKEKLTEDVWKKLEHLVMVGGADYNEVDADKYSEGNDIIELIFTGEQYEENKALIEQLEAEKNPDVPEITEHTLNEGDSIKCITNKLLMYEIKEGDILKIIEISHEIIKLQNDKENVIALSKRTIENEDLFEPLFPKYEDYIPKLTEEEEEKYKEVV